MIRKSIQSRRARETRLKIYGITSICFALIMLATLLISIGLNGYSAFQQAYFKVDISVNMDKLVDDSGTINKNKMNLFNWDGLVKSALREFFPEVKERDEKKELFAIISANAGYDLKEIVRKKALGSGSHTMSVWLHLSDDADQYLKGRLSIDIPEEDRRINNKQIAWVNSLVERDIAKLKFNKTFFTSADSREPESAGILGSVVGSALTLFVTVMFALPLAVMASIYLEYFAKPGRITDFIEVNINNLAAVPSIVFGLLGLSVFLSTFGLPRSAPLVGGLVLGLMTLPTIIIASRASIRSIPPSIREAALGLGASKMQAAMHHVLPLAAPGILTGTIIGMAQALGETAPLLMIGMVAFIIDIPTTFTSSATAMPVQIYMWSDSAERAFYERSSLAILFLVAFLISMNLLAVVLRKKFEKKW